MAIIPSNEMDFERPELPLRPMPVNGWDEGPLQEPVASAGIDYLGIAWRRKWILILFGLLGAAVSYLVYSQTPTTYESRLRLMISTQSPPMMVNGDTVLQSVSLPKHESLIVSDLVLSSAIRNGKLEEMDTFPDYMSPVAYLKSFVSVESVAEASDALDLTCKGKKSEDLPEILRQIVNSYQSVIAEDSIDVGRDSVIVMETMQKKLEAEREKAEARYYELFKKLGLTSGVQDDQISNPFSQKLASLNLRLEEDTLELEDVLVRLKTLINFNNNAEKKDENAKLLAVEARRYLQLTTEKQTNSGLRTSEAIQNLPLEMQRSYARLVKQIDELESRISDRQMDKARYARSYGSKHFQMRVIDSDLASMVEQERQVRNELKALDDEAAKLMDDIDAEPLRTVSQLTKESEQEAVRLYALALTRDRDRLSEGIALTKKRLEETEEMSASISADLTELNILKNQIDEKRSSIREVLDRLAEMNVLAGTYTYTKVRVIDPPGNGYPVAPVLLQYLGVGVVLASMLGFGLAFLVDWSDHAYRNPQEILTALRTPVLGKIPVIRDAKKSKNRTASLITIHRSNSVASEAFRSIRTSIAFAAGKSSSRVFMLTSPSPGDGKSTITANLAVSLAQMGRKVLLVDADYRRPRVHQIFDLEMQPGMLNYLDGSVELDDAVREVSAMPGLFALTTGGYPKNPGELVSSAKFGDILQQLRPNFDFILIDSPPVLPVADAAGMSAFVDGVVMVIRIRRGVMVASQKAKEQLDMVSARMTGVIVNGVDNNPYYSDYGRYGYRYGYGYGYGNHSGYGKYYDSQKASYHDNIEQE